MRVRYICLTDRALIDTAPDQFWEKLADLALEQLGGASPHLGRWVQTLEYEITPELTVGCQREVKGNGELSAYFGLPAGNRFPACAAN